MALFNFGKKKKAGARSTISHLRSPYTAKKPALPSKIQKRVKKKHSLLVAPAGLRAPHRSHRLLWILCALLLIGGLVYLTSFSNFFYLQSWETEGDGILLEVDDPINQLIALEKGKNILFLNEANLISQVKALHPNIKNIVIRKILPKKLRVEFENYPIAANIVNVVGKIQKKFLIDTMGFLTEENSENPELPYIKIETGVVLPIKTVVIAEAKLDYIIKAINLFEEKFSMKVLDAQYMVREREVHLRTEKYFAVWIDMEKDLMSQVEKLRKALSKLDIYHTSLQYIDLRISGNNSEKVIFKRR